MSWDASERAIAPSRLSRQYAVQFKAITWGTTTGLGQSGICISYGAVARKADRNLEKKVGRP